VLKLLDITLKFCAITMFLIFKTYAVFHTDFVGVYIIHLHIIFHMPCSNDSLVIAIRPKARYRFHAAAILFFIVRKNHICFLKICYQTVDQVTLMLLPPYKFMCPPCYILVHIDHKKWKSVQLGRLPGA
jgi:hypothetical protein